MPGLCLTRLSLARRPGQNSRGLEAGRPGRRLADTPGDGARSGHLSDDGEGVGVREKWADTASRLWRRGASVTAHERMGGTCLNTQQLCTGSAVWSSDCSVLYFRDVAEFWRVSY